MGSAYRYVAGSCFCSDRIEDADDMVKANLGAKNHAVIMPDGNIFPSSVLFDHLLTWCQLS